MKLRSYSFVKKNQDTGLAKENSILKDRVHQMKFLVEDNLDILINELDQDFRNQALISDVPAVFCLVKSNIDRWRNQIVSYGENIQTLEKQLENVKENEQRILALTQQQINNLTESHQILIKEKDNVVSQLNKQIADLQLKLQNCQEKLIEQTTQTDQKIKINQGQLTQKITSLENDIISIKQQHQFEIQAILHNHEKDRKFMKEEIENATSAVEQKYKKYYMENQQLQEKMQKGTQSMKQLKQQKDSLEKQIEQQNQKVKQHIEDLANERKMRAKDIKQQNELQEQIGNLQNKLLCDEKRYQRMKDQITQQEDQMQTVLKLHNQQISELNAQIFALQKLLDEGKRCLNAQQQNYEQQLQIQRVKYEIQLGKSISYEDQQYQQFDFSCQYDDQVQIDFINGLQQQIKEQQLTIVEKSQQIADQIVKYQKLQLSLSQQIEQKVGEAQSEFKLLSKKRQQDFDNQREKLQMEFNCKVTLLQQQLSHETDKLRCEIKDNLMKIELLEQKIIEKDQTLEYVSEQLQISKEDHYNDKKQTTQEILSLQQQHQRTLSEQKTLYELKINELQTQLSQQYSSHEQINQQYQQQLKNNQEIKNELKDQKVQNQQYRMHSDKLAKELKIQQDLVKSLNDRVKQLYVEVENAKQTYNIFTKTQRIPVVMSSEIKLTKLRTSPMNRRLRSISNTRLQQQLQFQ